jgi:hypothetical protein
MRGLALGLLAAVAASAISPASQALSPKATWRADRGWKVSDTNLQDFDLTVRLKCQSDCGPGILFGAPANLTGEAVLLSLTEGSVGQVFSVQLADGKIVDRKPLEGGPNPFAGAGVTTPPAFPPPPPAPPAAAAPPPSDAPPPPRFGPPPIKLAQNGVNVIEVGVRNGVVHGDINGQSLGGLGGFQTAVPKYGRLGLPADAAQVSDIRLEDLIWREGSTAKPEAGFTRLQLHDMFVSEGVAAGDIDGDGHKDVVAGPFVYYGPDFKRVRKIYADKTFGPATYSNSLMQFVADVDGDGKPDVIEIGLPGTPAIVYFNPGDESRYWDRAVAIPSVGTEEAELVDLDGSHKPTLLYGRAVQGRRGQSEIGYAQPDPRNPRGPWVFTTISEPGPYGNHGFGAGDINGDGRVDIIQATGWFEQPAQLGGKWTFHPYAFGSGADMFAYDVDGDGLNDVVSSINAHGWGLAWFQQKRTAKGIDFVEHDIMGRHGEPAGKVSFSELHAVGVADMDGDGLKDIVTGKRWWAHLDSDSAPDPRGAPVLYWFKLIRSKSGVRFEPHLIDNRSGLGTQIAVVDMNGDGRPDVLTSARHGTYVFLNQLTHRRPAKAAATASNKPGPTTAKSQ